MKNVVVCGLLAVLVWACGSSNAPATSVTAGGACGAPIFMSAQCENQVSLMCCNQKNDCAKDASCNQIAQCIVGCKRSNGGDTCTNGCVTGQAPSPEVQRGLGLWHGMIDCASKANVPNCGDKS